MTVRPLLIAVLIGMPMAAPQAAAETVSGYAGKVVVIPVGKEDLISRARFEFMSRTLQRCTDEGAEAVIFDIDTPGGLLWDTVDLMMNDLQELKPRSFAFVNKRALSAGAMIAVATDGIYMAPAGTAGAATPIYGNGTQMDEAERAKMNSATMGMARAVARNKGHNPSVIEAMIDMSKELKVGDLELDTKETVLTLDAEQAIMKLDGKPLFAKAIVDSLEAIQKAEKLQGALIIAEPTFFEHIAIWVTSYAAILILIGVAGGYLEMQAPGFGLPGLVSVAAFSLFFFGHYVAGSLVGHETAVMAGLFVFGALLVLVELAVLPGLMVPGILGFLCIMVALVYTMSGWEIATPAGGEPDAPSGWDFNLTTYATGLRHFATGLLGAAALLLILFRFLPESRPFQRLVLASSAGGRAGDTPAVRAALAVHPGDTGLAVTALRPYGTAEFDGNRVEVTADQGYLPNGSAVRVREIQGTRIVVEAIV